MSDTKKENLARWDLETLNDKWKECLESMITKKITLLPMERLKYQAENDPQYKDILGQWETMAADEREKAWDSLMQVATKNMGEMLPVCVRCGICCKQASPTMEQDDLELLREEQIPWENLYAVRVGEPAKSPAGKPMLLQEERIKVRVKPGTMECVFFDAEDAACTIYHDRPLQCRAQACWDPTQAEELAELTHLTRRNIFGGVDALKDLMDEHDAKCSFDALSDAFDSLSKSEGQTVDQVLDILAYDEHIRNFTVNEVKFPENMLDLLFGRNLSSRVRLFGYKVIQEQDGTRVLVPDATE